MLIVAANTTRDRYDFSDWRHTSYVSTIQNVDQPVKSSRIFTVKYVGSNSRMRDNNNKGFRQRVASGEIVLSDWFLERETRQVTNGLITLNDPSGYWDRLEGDLIQFAELPVSAPIGIDLGNAPDIVLAKAYAKINSSSFCTAENLKDLNSSLRMLRRPLSGAVDLLMKMSKSKQRRLAKSSMSVAKATSDTWLEYRYGWRPLMMDIDKTIDIVHGKRASLDKRLVARSGYQTETSSHGILGPASKPYGEESVDGSYTSTEVKSCNAGVIYSISAMNKASELETNLGLRPRDLLPSLWETIPYSFVADWFVNVGDWLQAVTPVPGITYLGHWVTSKCMTTNESRAVVSYGGAPTPTGRRSGSYGSSVRTWSQVVRICNGQLSFTPVWKGKSLSKLNQIDATALALQPVLSGLGQFKH